MINIELTDRQHDVLARVIKEQMCSLRFEIEQKESMIKHLKRCLIEDKKETDTKNKYDKADIESIKWSIKNDIKRCENHKVKLIEIQEIYEVINEKS